MKPTPSVPPRWLSRAEKAQFRRLCEQREAAGRPVSATEVDALADLVSLRGRIGDVRRIYDRTIAGLRAHPDWQMDKQFALRAARQLDAMTVTAHRLGARLGFGPAE